MALLGSDFDPNIPQDTDPISEAAANIRDIKKRLKDFLAVQFDLETGLFTTPQSTVNVVTTLPATATVGDTVYNTTDNTAYVYLSGGWTPFVRPSLPLGSIVPYAGTFASIATQFANLGGTWNACDHSAISRTTYADLFALVGTTYGTGDGSTTFNVPDLRDTFIIGANSDQSGTPKTNIVDATGTNWQKSRGYTAHQHTMPFGLRKLDGSTGSGDANLTSNDETPRAIPPFMAFAHVIRIK